MPAGAAVSNLGKDPLAHLVVVEMSGEDRWRQADTAKNPDATVNGFLDWLFEGGFFDYAVIVADRANLLTSAFGSSSRQLPGVWLDSTTARKRATESLNRVLKGFEIIFGTTATPDVCQTFFTKLGYVVRKAEHNDLKSGFLEEAWNSQELEEAVRVAARLGAKCFCCFAHDADPVYLLTWDAG